MIGKNIRELRLTHRPPMTQQTLALKCGFSNYIISRIEHSKRKVSSQELVILANALDVDVSELLNEGREEASI